LTLETAPDGTTIVYVSNVEIKSLFIRIFGGLLLRRFALRYWERAVVGAIRQMLE
jgi:hypothetical protein